RSSDLIELLGRGSTVINTGGEKVYPEEVEAVLKAHPAVADAIVVAAPDERLGQRVSAVIALTGPRRPSDKELRDHCRQRLAGFKVPRTIRVVDEVKRTAGGQQDYRWASRGAREPAPALSRCPPPVRPRRRLRPARGAGPRAAAGARRTRLPVLSPRRIRSPYTGCLSARPLRSAARAHRPGSSHAFSSGHRPPAPFRPRRDGTAFPFSTTRSRTWRSQSAPICSTACAAPSSEPPKSSPASAAAPSR